MNMKKYCIPETYTLRNAMEHFSFYAEQFAIIVDEKNSILGVLTDGNIRRAIIAGVDLEDSVVKAMQKKFSTCNKDMNATKALFLMENRGFSHLPIVSAEKDIYGVWSRKELQSKIELPNTVVIMVGGLGSRLGHLTQNLPKPMLPVAGRPILEIILENIRHVGFCNFYFAVNYKAEIIQNHFGDGDKFNCNINYLHEKKRLGTAGALSLLPPQEKDVIVVNGDILTHANARHILLQHQIMRSFGTILAKRYSMQVPYGVLDTDKNGELLRVSEKPKFDYFISAGMNVLSPSILQYIPKDTFFDMPDLFTILMQEKKKVQVFETEEYWLDIGQIPDYEKALEEFIYNR